MRKSVGRYQLKAELGSGGMAKVYLAFDPQFEREVAIKVLPRDLLEKPGLRERFTREAKVIASLEHSAIVPVYDFGEDDGQPYLVMRYLRGGNLSDRMDGDPLPQKQILEILRRTAAALQAAHDHDIIHRDVKPANILFDTHENAHLSDFGIVKLGKKATTLTGDSVIGTPQYMSPEQARGDHNLDNRTDIYSLGVVLFQMLTGKTPYEADTPMGVAVKHVTDPVPTLNSYRPDLPAQFNEIISKSMAKDPADRYQSVDELPIAFIAASKKETVVGAAARRVEPGPTLVPEKAAAETKVRSAPELDKEPKARRFPWIPIGIGVLAIVIIAAFLGTRMLGGGAATQATEAPTERPSQQPVAVQPTNTAAPTQPPPTSEPTPLPAVSYSDDFESDVLAPEWRWIREPVNRWNLLDRQGWLTIQTDSTTLLDSSGDSPVLLRWTAPGDFDLTARLMFEPTSNFQIAGIIAYQDDDNFVSVLRAYCDPDLGTCVGDGAYVDNDQAFMKGEQSNNSVGGLPESQPVLLRLIKEGDSYTGMWATEQGEWQVVTETSAELSYPQLGVYANSSLTGASSIPAQFDFLEVKTNFVGDNELSAWNLAIPPDEPVRLAILTSEGGVVGSTVQAIEAGAELAIADFGTIQGFPIEVVGYPSQCSVIGGGDAVRQIIESGYIAGVIGPTCSAEVRGGMGQLEEARIVALSPSATQSNLAQYGPTVFNRVVLHSNQAGSREGQEANDIARVRDFYGEVEARTGVALQGYAAPFAAYAYDATKMLLETIAHESEIHSDGYLVLDRLDLARALRTVDTFTGLTGEISFEEDGDRALP